MRRTNLSVSSVTQNKECHGRFVSPILQYQIPPFYSISSFFHSFLFISMDLLKRFYCSLERPMIYCMEDFLGGPKPFQVRSAVNLQVGRSLDFTLISRKEERFCTCFFS